MALLPSALRPIQKVTSVAVACSSGCIEMTDRCPGLTKPSALL